MQRRSLQLSRSSSAADAFVLRTISQQCVGSSVCLLTLVPAPVAARYRKDECKYRLHQPFVLGCGLQVCGERTLSTAAGYILQNIHAPEPQQ